jgi:pyroglutamyl-peptidase
MAYRVLLTGFEPFGGESVNPSWEAARRLDGWTCGGQIVEALQLPCVYDASRDVLAREIEQRRPIVLLCLGQAGGRADLAVERVAINLDDAESPDNAGVKRLDRPIVADGPAAYFASLPVKAIVAAIRVSGAPASLSPTAGNFVCNHAFYGACHLRAEKYPTMRVGLIHVPFSPEQGVRHPGAATMAIETIVIGVKAAIAAALKVEAPS